MGRRSWEIVCFHNAKGLARDVLVLQQALKSAGINVTTNKFTRVYDLFASSLALSTKARKVGLRNILLAFLRAWRRLMEAARRDRVHVFLETLPTAQLLRAGRIIFVPNPECLFPRDQWKLPLVNMIAAKTRYTEKLFSASGYPTCYLGFTSIDCALPHIVPDRNRFLHIASAGDQKGTAEILDAWRRHPEWPNLTVLGGSSRIPLSAPDNVTLIKEWLSEEDLRALMQHSGVHLCCSNAEGFGHSIVEAMSCGVLVITTDFPPMNEHINEDRGILVAVRKSRPYRFGEYAIIEPEDVEAAVQKALDLSDSEFQRRATNARKWFLANDEAFRRRVRDFVDPPELVDP